MLVGLKSDLEGAREVTPAEATALAAQHQISYIELSAKAGTNVEEAISRLALI